MERRRPGRRHGPYERGSLTYLLVLLGMVSGQPWEYWARQYEQDERLVHTAYEIARMMQGGKPRENRGDDEGFGGRRVQYSG